MQKRFTHLLGRVSLLFRGQSFLKLKIGLTPTITANFVLINMYLLWNSNKVEAQDKKDKANKQPQPQQTSSNNHVFALPDHIKSRANKTRMVLVMDLDETMVYTRRKRRPQHNNFIQFNLDDTTIYVEFRPMLAEFLAAVSQIFTIYVYTAGTKPYADKVLDSIPNGHVIKQRFYRQSCVDFRGGLIKDLQMIKDQQDPGKKYVLVDDNTDSISFNYPNAIRIQAYEGSQEDQQLEEVYCKLLSYYQKCCVTN